MSAPLAFTAEAVGAHVATAHQPCQIRLRRSLGGLTAVDIARSVERDMYPRGWANDPKGDFDVGRRRK